MSKRILVVEYQPDNRQIIRDMLAPADYEITEAENGEQALAAIAKQRPDLILMDIQLPIMDGYKLQAGSKPIRRCDRSRSSRSPPMCSAAKKRKRGRQAAMTMCRNHSASANCCRKFVSTYLNRFVALHMSAFGGKADIQLFPIISVIGSNRNPVRKRRVRSERPPIQNQVLGVSGHLGEARQRIISAVIQATNSTAVVSLFVDL